MIFDPQMALDLPERRGPRPNRANRMRLKDHQRPPQDGLSVRAIRACRKLADYIEPTAEPRGTPRQRMPLAERMADPDVRTFHDELRAYRMRHPGASLVGRDRPTPVLGQFRRGRA